MNYEIYSTFDNPVEYKSIKIFPVKVKDYLIFSSYATCLIQDKNSIPDPSIISMSYLDYMLHMTKENIEETPYILWFDRLMSLCLLEQKSEFDNIENSMKKYKLDSKGKLYFTINSVDYNSSDFEKIREIILSLNLMELPDENVQKEVRDSIRKAKEYKDKLNDSKQGSFEDFIISLAISTGWTFEYIYEMSVRKFIKSIRRLDNLIHYKIYLSASLSGMVEFKDKSFIKHWLTDLDSEDNYKDVTMNVDEVNNKLSLESAKK